MNQEPSHVSSIMNTVYLGLGLEDVQPGRLTYMVDFDGKCR